MWVRNLDHYTRKMAEGERLLEMAKAGRIVDAHDGRYGGGPTTAAPDGGPRTTPWGQHINVVVRPT